MERRVCGKMKKDTSRILYNRYFRLANRNIEILLKNGRKIHGRIVGYFSSDADSRESPIHHWHIINGKGSSCRDYSGIGVEQGELIRHCDIASVTFEEDNSTLFF